MNSQLQIPSELGFAVHYFMRQVLNASQGASKRLAIGVEQLHLGQARAQYCRRPGFCVELGLVCDWFSGSDLTHLSL